MMNKPRILVFIPAYRCERQVVRVIDQFDERVQAWVDTVMVVDNRSPDQTLQAAIGRARQRLTGCNFIGWRNDDNYGLGGSHKAALAYAAREGFDYLVVLHGDDQGNIHDLLPQLEAGAHLNADCLLGARFMPGSSLQGYSHLRTFGNRVYNLLFSAAAGHRIYDLGSGLNLYSMAAYRNAFYHTFPDDLTFNYMMLMGAYHAGQKVRFFPISWREDDQVSNVRLFSQAAKVLRLLGGYVIRRGAFLGEDMRARRFAAYTGEIVHQHAPVTS